MILSVVVGGSLEHNVEELHYLDANIFLGARSFPKF